MGTHAIRGNRMGGPCDWTKETLLYELRAIFSIDFGVNIALQFPQAILLGNSLEFRIFIALQLGHFVPHPVNFIPETGGSTFFLPLTSIGIDIKTETIENPNDKIYPIW